MKTEAEIFTVTDANSCTDHSQAVKDQTQLECARARVTSNLRPFQSGPANPNWRGGKSKNESGYIRIWAGANRGSYEHRIVAQQAWGPRVAFPSNCDVHHMDHRRNHNCRCNLIILESILHEKTSNTGAKMRWTRLISSSALFCLLLLLPMPSSAQTKHKAFFRSGWWWIATAERAAVIGADAYSTRVALNACPSCGDNFMFFPVTSNRTIIAGGSVGFGISTAFSVLEYHVSQQSTNRKIHILGYLMQPATDTAEHGYGIVSNLQGAARCHYPVKLCF